MILDFSSRTLIILYVTIVWMQGIYFTAFTNPFTISITDALIVIGFNILCVWAITTDVLKTVSNLPEKPRSSYMGLGSTMNEHMWGMFYDYKVIVERHDRKRFV